MYKRQIPRFWTRLALGYPALVSLEIGAWALLAPRSFYDGFPGMGRAWVAVDGPYNEHLVRDVGALNLALAIVLVWAAIDHGLVLLRVAAVAALMWGLPHFVYHAANTDQLSTADVVLNLIGLGLFVAAPLAVLIASTAGTREMVR